MKHYDEVAIGQRFEFGENWWHFLSVLDDRRIEVAECSLRSMLGVETLTGSRFLDIGSGSGLFSLAARRLGACVISFDYDPQSVACTTELRRRYRPNDSDWFIQEGSVLDGAYLETLGQFEIVYSWGVLHHTGDMWQALENASARVRPNGKLFVSLYNDQGWVSDAWRLVKRLYNRSPKISKTLIVSIALLRLWGPTTVRDLLRGRPFSTWRSYSGNRGMTPWTDVVDWVGGYPFEVAKPDVVTERMTALGFRLQDLKTCGKGHGCNEFVFLRNLN